MNSNLVSFYRNFLLYLFQYQFCSANKFFFISPCYGLPHIAITNHKKAEENITFAISVRHDLWQY